MAIEIVDFPIKKNVIFYSYVKLPEGKPWLKMGALRCFGESLYINEALNGIYKRSISHRVWVPEGKSSNFGWFDQHLLIESQRGPRHTGFT